MNRLNEKVALVTGAASGLGRAIAEHFIAEGARVAFTDIDPAGAQIAAASGGLAVFLQQDVTSEAAWQASITQTLQHFGRLDILVNNAGITLFGTIESLALADFQAMLSVDLTGVFLGCKYGVQAMKETGGGSIINISSISGIRASAEYVGYNAAKAGVTLMTRSVALHCAQSSYKIRCNSIHPGVIHTAILDKVLAQVANPQAVMEGFIALHPVGHIGEPADISAMAVYLASDEAKFITGSAFTVDGGATI